MKYRELKNAVSKETGLSIREVSIVLDATVSVIKEAFIDSDYVTLGDIGSMELQYKPAIEFEGNRKQEGRIHFSANRTTLNRLIEASIEMLGEEEKE